jgi:hypothetical protein
MNLLLLLDVPPPNAVPVRSGGSLIALALVALSLAATLLVGTVFLIRRIRRRKAHSDAIRAKSPHKYSAD